MKITRVEPILIAVPFEHGGPKPKRSLGSWDRIETLLVRVETDAGIVGWGEAFGNAVSPVTHAAVQHVLGPLSLGQDPSDVEALMTQLRKKTQNMGRTGPVRYALSGIDIALWDIAGKMRGQPLCALLGGARRKRVPAYASFLRYGDLELIRANVEVAVGAGYRAIKLHEHSPAAVGAARRVAGPDIELMLDVNCAWTFDEAAAVVAELAEHDIGWLEEPISPPDDYDALGRLRSITNIEIAAGENVGSAREVIAIAERDALDIFQPSVSKIGGIGEMRDAISIALQAGMLVRPHSPFVGPALLATLHVLATLDDPHALCERIYCTLDASVAGHSIDVVDGAIDVPHAPGLGMTIDDDVVKRYRVR